MGSATFSRGGAAVAKLTNAMKKSLLVLLFCSLTVIPAEGQNWSLGAGVGPFVFGDFLKRTLKIGNEGGTGQQTTRLSAATRAGLTVDVDRNLFSDRFAIKGEASYTRAPLAVKGSTGSGVELDAGEMTVTTLMLPLVLRINPRGTFRFHVMGGPAYAMYDIDQRENASSSLVPFAESRSRFGWAFGGGVGWYFNQRFALEAQINDISTESPFQPEDFPAGFGRVEIERPHNVHSTLGIRYRF
jgi:opacity protein-like surface antigen